jgi:DNA gyrase subunit B
MGSKKINMKKINKKEEYTAKDIYVLKGLEPVRKRPGMYIGSTGVSGIHHLIWECIDNSLDEAMAGYCKNIPNNKIRTVDDGRGIPVDKHPQTGKSALETVMTTLHAGAKFGGKAYQVAGGLHGVGVSVVCALSKHMTAEVCRGSERYVQEYSEGKPTTKVRKLGACEKRGTTITFEPDATIFEEVKFDIKKILNHLRQQAYLTSGVKITVYDQRESSNDLVYNFYFEGGLRSYVKYLVGEAETRNNNVFYTKNEKQGILVEVALQYAQEMEALEQSFANNIFTGEGGSHLTGFRTALTRVLNDYAKKNGYLKEKDENFTGNDVREGLIGVVSIKIREPQFEGQTKAKLGNTEAKLAVEQALSEGLIDFLERNPQDARAIIENSLISAKARRAAKAAKSTVLRKGMLSGLSLPGKLADCSSRKPEESEIYIVEGDSAGGSCKMARDRRFQAILPLKGKILNVERARLDRILTSEEIKSLIIALGAAISQDFNIDKLRYYRIILMSDADVDGAHIRTLLLTLFFRYFREIIEKGYLYIAQPPLYKIQFGKSIEYAYTDADKEEILSNLGEKGAININIQRYKGLGEMNPDELWNTTMDPENRTLLKVEVEDAKEADHIFDVLMGKEVFPRKKFIQVHAKKVKNLDI